MLSGGTPIILAYFTLVGTKAGSSRVSTTSTLPFVFLLEEQLSIIRKKPEKQISNNRDALIIHKVLVRFGPEKVRLFGIPPPKHYFSNSLSRPSRELTLKIPAPRHR